MASAIDATYLRTAVKNILDGSTTLQDNDGDPVFLTAQEYLSPRPTEVRWLAANFFGVGATFELDGMPNIKQVWSVPFRLSVGKVGQEYTGVQVAKLWEYVPLFVNFLWAHPTAQFSNATTFPPHIDAGIGVSVEPTIVVGVQEDDEGAYIWAEVTVNIPFNVGIERIKYQDGNEVIIT